MMCMLVRLDQTLMWQMKLTICNQIKCLMMIKIIGFSKNYYVGLMWNILLKFMLLLS
jgi:hypothetical protein